MSEYLTFEEHVDSQRNEPAELADTVRLYAPGSAVATADIRHKGAMVLYCALESASTGPAVVLTSTAVSFSDYSVPKLGATHPMGPVGPYDGPGGQHGSLRWLTYDGQPTPHEQRPHRLDLTAHRPDWPVRVERSAQFVSASMFVLDTRVTNTSSDDFGYSLGEHAYFAMPVPPQSAKDLKVNGMTLDDARVGGGGAFEDVMQGKPLYWSGFDSQVVVAFPDGREVRISAEHDVRANNSADMLIWHRQGTDTICFEPILGCVPDESNRAIADNQRLTVAVGHSARLLTAVELL